MIWFKTLNRRVGRPFLVGLCGYEELALLTGAVTPVTAVVWWARGRAPKVTAAVVVTLLAWLGVHLLVERAA